MTKAELIDAIVNAADAPEGLTKKDAQRLLELTFEQLKVAVKKDGKFTLSGFGTFQKKDRLARDGRNPRTGETVKIAASSTMAFKPATELKRYLTEK